MESLDVKPAYELGRKALETCLAAGEKLCPSWEALRMELYLQHVKAGIDSGIDPRRDPRGWQRAADSANKTIRLNGSGTDAGDPGSASK